MVCKQNHELTIIIPTTNPMGTKNKETIVVGNEPEIQKKQAGR